MPPVLLAATAEPDRVGSMVLYFLVAVAIVGPYGVFRVRRILRERVERGAPGISWRGGGANAPARDDLSAEGRSATGDDPGELAMAIEAIEVGARTDAPFEVRVPARPRLNGGTADTSTVETLLADALRRSGVVVVADDATAEGRVMTCRRA